MGKKQRGGVYKGKKRQRGGVYTGKKTRRRKFGKIHNK